MVVSNMFYFHPYLGKWFQLAYCFQMGGSTTTWSQLVWDVLPFHVTKKAVLTFLGEDPNIPLASCQPFAGEFKWKSLSHQSKFGMLVKIGVLSREAPMHKWLMGFSLVVVAAWGLSLFVEAISLGNCSGRPKPPKSLQFWHRSSMQRNGSF